MAGEASTALGLDLTLTFGFLSHIYFSPSKKFNTFCWGISAQARGPEVAMVRIVNGQVVGSAGSAGQKRPGPEWTRGAGRSENPAAARAKGPLDVVAGFFWSARALANSRHDFVFCRKVSLWLGSVWHLRNPFFGSCDIRARGGVLLRALLPDHVQAI